MSEVIVFVDDEFNMPDHVMHYSRKHECLKRRLQFFSLNWEERRDTINEMWECFDKIFKRQASSTEPSQFRDSETSQLEDSDQTDKTYFKGDTVPDDQKSTRKNLIETDDKELHDDGSLPYPDKSNQVHRPRRV